MVNSNLAERGLRYISEITTTITSRTQAERILHLVVDRLVRMFQCQTGAIITIHPKTEYLQIANACGISLTFAKQFHRTINVGAVADLLWTGRPLIIPDASVDPLRADELKLEQPFASCVCLPLSINHRSLGYLHLDATKPFAFSQEDMPFIGIFTDLAAIALDRSQMHEELLHLERVDRESGLDKYSFFIERLQEIMERALRFNETMGILVIDVDNYKEIINTYGTESCSKFIREFGMLIQRLLRPIDIACRYGTDEFVILYPNTPTVVVLDAAEGLRSSIEQTGFTDKSFRTTVSIGVGIYPHDGSDMRMLMLNAKNAVLEAQRSGRNTVHYSRRPVQTEV